MIGGDDDREMTPDELEREERWSRGTALGEAVWIRMCKAAGFDPKDPRLKAERGDIVGATRSAFFAMDGEGLDGLSKWLDMEEWIEMKETRG